jgi:hypothetical protein
MSRCERCGNDEVIKGVEVYENLQFSLEQILPGGKPGRVSYRGKRTLCNSCVEEFLLDVQKRFKTITGHCGAADTPVVWNARIPIKNTEPVIKGKKNDSQ